MSFKKIRVPDPKALAKSPTGSQTRELASVRDHQAYATRKAGQLVSLYRKVEASNPEAFVAGMGAMLSEYPSEIIDYVCDPRTGLARSLVWGPSIAEVAAACDERVKRQRTIDELRKHAETLKATLTDPGASKAKKRDAQERLDRWVKLGYIDPY